MGSEKGIRDILVVKYVASPTSTKGVEARTWVKCHISSQKSDKLRMLHCRSCSYVVNFWLYLSSTRVLN